MLSILIPTYNYNSVTLVTELHKQCNESGITYEILVFDDDSSEEYKIANRAINDLSNCTYKELEFNIGRSAIRNMLAKSAAYELLLFVDAGTSPSSENFIGNYLKHKLSLVVSGGMTASKNKPKKPYVLRWLYTKERERNTYCSSNFLIHKRIFETVKFDETLKTYGYEDVLFFKELHQKNIKITESDNPVIHHSDENATTFIKKTEIGINNLLKLIDESKLDNNTSKLTKSYKKLSQYKLTGVIRFFFSIFKKSIVTNLKSSNPSLLLFDFYKLGYYCKTKHS